MTEADGNEVVNVVKATDLPAAVCFFEKNYKKSEKIKNGKKMWKWAKIVEIHIFFPKKLKFWRFLNFPKNHIFWLYEKNENLNWRKNFKKVELAWKNEWFRIEFGLEKFKISKFYIFPKFTKL